MGVRVAAGASLPVWNGLEGAEKDRNLPSGLRGWRAVTCRAVSAGLTPHPTDGRQRGSVRGTERTVLEEAWGPRRKGTVSPAAAARLVVPVAWDRGQGAQ